MAFFSHCDWELQVVDRSPDRPEEPCQSMPIGNQIDLEVPREMSADECRYCLCQPCASSSQPSWLGTGQQGRDQNAGLRKVRYKKYWTLLDRRGAWRDDRYLREKRRLMRMDGVVVTRREVMPKCVIDSVRSLYPNHRNPYVGHRWE